MALEAVKRLLRRIKLYRASGGQDGGGTAEERLEKCLRPYQRYLSKARDVLLWERPSETFAALFALNMFFWFLARMECRVYGVLFTGALAFVTYEAWTLHVWPEIRAKPRRTSAAGDAPSIPNPQPEVSVPELSQYAACVRAAVSDQFCRLKALRATQPGLYCALMSGVCLVLAGVGSAVSGLGLLYLATMLAMLIPGAYLHLLQPETKQQITQALCKIKGVIRPPEGSVNVEEYLPESSKENLAVFALAGDFNSDSNASTSTSTDECPLGSVMPSHEESSMDALDSLSLDPFLHKEDLLRFKNTHFNGDDSSPDEEDKLLERDAPDRVDDAPSPSPSALSDAIAKNLAKLSANPLHLLGLLQAPRPPPPPAEDSDSEFEIIETDDIS